jgi:hypothetical protein
MTNQDKGGKLGKGNQKLLPDVTASYIDGGKSLWVNLGFAAANFSILSTKKTQFNQGKTK